MKNTLILFLLSIICGILKANDFDPFKFENGTGNPDNPYLISSQDQLLYLADMVNENRGCSAGVYFKLNRDINLTRAGISIGNSNAPFEGTFDGAKYRIVNLSQRFYANGDAGLFGHTQGATIRRLTIDSGKIFGEQGTFGGSLIGYASRTKVDSCFVRGVDVIFPGHTGGLIGYAVESKITDCSFSGSVTGSGQSTGGLIGYAENDTIIQCFSEGTVTGSNYTGGFIGKMDQSKTGDNTIQNCYSTCKTTGIGNVGGFIGYVNYLLATINITGCYATGAVSGQSEYVGGFIGYCCNYGAKKTVISDCYSTGDVISNSNDVGGFIGSDTGSTINRCYAGGSVSGKESVGGFNGHSDSSISYCYSVGFVEGNQHVGGFIGYSTGGNVSECFASGAVIDGNIFAAGNSNFFGGFVGSGYSEMTSYNCFFDKQGTGLTFATGLGVQTNIQGLTTVELIQKNLVVFLSNNWEFSLDIYPQLKVFALSAHTVTKALSALSAIPLILANNTELSSDVQTIFRLTDQIAENALEWITDPSQKVTVFNNAVYAEASNAWRTLTVRAGKIERTIKFRTTKGLLAAEILGVRINYMTYDNVDEQFAYHIECGSKDESAFAEIILAPYSECTPGSPVTLYANIPQEIVVTTSNGKIQTYIFTAEKHLPSDIFVQRWPDVLSINNNFATNGGYIFTGYEWFMDGVKLQSTKGYIQYPNGLNKSATYYAVLTTQQGATLTTCPAIFSDNKATKMAIWPNPVQRGQSVHVETGIAAGEPASALMQMFNPTGNIVAQQTLHNPVAEIAIPDTPGQYILRIVTNGDSQTFKIAVE